MCDVLGVSPAGYYAWRGRPESPRAAANRELVDDIKRVHRDTNGRYGSPRVHAELRAQGRGASRGRIERLMRRHGIRAIMTRPRRERTTDSRHDFPIAPNLVERNFSAAAPNRIWLADITYVETDQGWLYLATVMDLYSRKIVGWAMADHLRAELPLAALAMAIATQRPGAGLIHHSDRGVQGGFKWSSQQLDEGGCDEHSKAAFGSIWAGTIVVTRSTAGCRPRRAATLLGSDRGRDGK
jgi:transposase InsO family protein